MTLSEIADYVCTMIGQTDEASVAACKLFARRRAQMIWDFGLWKETMLNVTPAAVSGVYVLPSQCDQVISARMGDTDIRPFDQSSLIRQNSAIYTETTTQGFVFLPPACLPGSGVDIEILEGVNLLANIGDAFTLATSGLYTGSTSTGFFSGGVSIADLITVLPSQALVYFYSSGGLPGVGWRESNAGAVDQSAVSFATASAFYITRSSDYGPFIWTLPLASSASGQVRIFSTDATDLSQTLTLKGQITNGREASETLVVNAANAVESIHRYVNLSAIGLDVACAGTLYVAGAGGGGIAIPPGTLSAASRPRVQLLGATPTDTVTFLCKRRFPDLAGDGAPPVLRNCEDALISLTQADMLKRQRQYAKAQAMMADGASKLQIMLDLEKNQSADAHRIIPEDCGNGYGAYYENQIFGSGKEYWS